MSAETRLDSARSLLTAGPTSANWGRWVCWAARLAVEGALREFWLTRCPGLVGATMRGQLLALRVYLDPDTARRVAALWCALSQAAHHHAYELPPAVGDLTQWVAEAEAVVAVLRRG